MPGKSPGGVSTKTISRAPITTAIRRDNIRLYGMVNFAGIEYYDGAAWRPVNDYYGYGLPITDPARRPTAT